MVNLQVDKPIEGRKLYGGDKLSVYWLAMPGGTLPACDEYRDVDDAKVKACLNYIDTKLGEGRRIPKERMEGFEHKNVPLLEVKAPPRGKRIYRLLCYRHRDWDLFVAFAGTKKSIELPRQWKETAAQRVKQSLDAGGP